MKTSLFVLLAVTMLAAPLTFAQANPQLRVNIPFDFAAGKYLLPAGEYYVRISYDPNAIAMQRADGRQAVVVLSHGAQPQGPADQAKLVFNAYGSRFFLSQVFTSGRNLGEELPRTHDELEQLAARHASKTVTIAASLR